jgi:glycosyltransferase involved in cell wall biosynthesis
LVAAMASLDGKTLAIAGGPQGAAEGVRALAGALGVADRVTLVGVLPPARVAPFLLSGRIGVCPLKRGVDSVSDKFTSPLKLLQMMALGLPIVASDVAPVRALVTDGQEALLAPADDPRALAAAIGRLLDRPEDAKRLGAMAQRRAKAFTWAQRARKLEDFLQALLQTRRAAWTARESRRGQGSESCGASSQSSRASPVSAARISRSRANRPASVAR